jgi:SAM-dependent methyltransferase
VEGSATVVTDAVGQYADDRNFRARQSLWATGRHDPPFELYPWVLARAGLDQGGSATVLDVGCGNGGYERAMVAAGHTGRRVGVDLSAGMLALVGNAGRVQADAMALPFAAGAFDVVLAPHMLYHVADVASAAGELRRVLRPGGVMVAVTNSVSSLAELRAMVEDAVGGGWRMVRPADATFSMERGAGPLRRAFSTVERVDVPPGRLVVDDADWIAAYVASIADIYEDEAGVTWTEVVERVRAAAADAIAADGAIRFTTASGAFVCG